MIYLSLFKVNTNIYHKNLVNKQNMFLLQIGAKYVYQQTQTGPNLYILLLHQVSSKHVKKNYLPMGLTILV